MGNHTERGETAEAIHYYATLRRRILASMIVVPAIPFIFLLITGFYYFSNSLEKMTEAKVRRVAEDHSQIIDLFLRERLRELQLIMDLYGYDRLADQPTLDQVFANLQTITNAFVDLSVFNEEGVHVAYHGPFDLLGKVYRDYFWFKDVVKEGHYISDMFLGYRKLPHIIIALCGKKSGRIWVIRATIDTDSFNSTVENIRIGETGEAYLLNKAGEYQTQPRSGGKLMAEDPDASKYLMRHEGTKIFVDEDYTGQQYLYATVWLKEKDWLLVVRQAEADALSALRTTAYLAILVAILGTIAIVSLAFYVTGRIIGRMEQMDAEKSQLTKQLIIAERLAEFGEMSAGFVHEINNPLQIIRSEQTLAEMILSEMRDRGDVQASEDFDQVFDSIRQIQVQVDRCGKITRGILDFARREEPILRLCDFRGLFPQVIDLVERKANVHGIVIKQDIAADTPVIRTDPGQLQQVMLNLFNNAIDAIVAKRGSAGGEILVRVRPSTDGWVEIAVTDNGSGISPENLAKVFTPFFTTKPVGKGTGLGLAVCYGIINSLGGTIRVTSTLGEGTTFTILLPA
jgi:two-component system, NtrC family, sensor kinase